RARRRLTQMKRPLARWIGGLAALLATAAAGTARADDPVEERWPDQAAWDVPGQYVVDFRDDADEGAIRSLLGSLHVAFRPTALEAETHVEIIGADPAGGAAALAAALRALEH